MLYTNLIKMNIHFKVKINKMKLEIKILLSSFTSNVPPPVLVRQYFCSEKKGFQLIICTNVQ